MAWNEPGSGKQRDPWKDGGGGNGPSPDFDAWLRKLRDGFGRIFGGGGGGGIGIAVLGILLAWVAFDSVMRINAGETGVVLRFGRVARLAQPGLGFKFPRPIETVIHVKQLPMFVSDITADDITILFDRVGKDSEFGKRLQNGIQRGAIHFAANAFWSAPRFFDRMPLTELKAGEGTLTVAKGDLNFRRMIGDVSVPVETRFQSLDVLPNAPILSLRSIKSYCVSGMDDWPHKLSKTDFPMDGSIVAVQQVPARATGTPVTPPAGLPTVTLDANGAPSLTAATGTAPTTLVTQPLIKGTGPAVTKGQTVVVNYTGWLWNGTKFDSSWDRGTTFPVQNIGQAQVIDGWNQGLVGQTVGSQILLIVPPSLGYGTTAQGSIPANSTLVFVVDILAAA